MPWNVIHLEAERSHITVRAEITKSKQAAVIPLLPVLFAEMAKLAAILPSSIAFPNSGKTCENLEKVVQSDPADFAAQTHDFRGGKCTVAQSCPDLGKLGDGAQGDSNPHRSLRKKLKTKTDVKALFAYLPQ